MPANVLIENLLDTVATDQRESFLTDYRVLSGLPNSVCHLQEFMDRYLDHLVRLYAATAGSIWFRSATSNELTTRARVGIDSLGLDHTFENPHKQLVAYAMTRPKSFLVKPFSAPARQAAVSNPTDSFIVFGPVYHQGEPISVVELFLGPTPVRGRTAADRNRYLLWLDHLLSLLCRGIEVRLLRTSAPWQLAVDGLHSAQAELEVLQQGIRTALEQKLNVFAGWNFGSLESNQAFTTHVHELLDQNALRRAGFATRLIAGTVVGPP